MRALLIRPWANKNVTSLKSFFVGEPLGILCVSTMLKELGIEVMFVDFMVKENGKLKDHLKKFNPDIVGITSLSTDVVNTVEVAREVKAYNSNIKVMVGGVQANCTPDAFFIPDIDFVFKSTTRENIKKLLEQLQVI